MEIGVLQFHWYGLMIGLGIIAAWRLAAYITKREQAPAWWMEQAFGWVIGGGILGARLYHVIDFWDYYAKTPLKIIALWEGGLGIWGGIMGGLIGLGLFCRIYRVPMLPIMDAAAFGLPLGQAIGRLGNWFNQELYGLPTNLPWGIYIQPAHRLPAYVKVAYYHPLFAYEAIGLLGLLGLLWFGYNRKVWPWGKGMYFAVYLVGYGGLRFGLEYLRLDPWSLGLVTVAQAFALMAITGGGIWWYVVRSRYEKRR